MQQARCSCFLASMNAAPRADSALQNSWTPEAESWANASTSIKCTICTYGSRSFCVLRFGRFSLVLAGSAHSHTSSQPCMGEGRPTETPREAAWQAWDGVNIQWLQCCRRLQLNLDVALTSRLYAEPQAHTKEQCSSCTPPQVPGCSSYTPPHRLASAQSKHTMQPRTVIRLSLESAHGAPTAICRANTPHMC